MCSLTKNIREKERDFLLNSSPCKNIKMPKNFNRTQQRVGQQSLERKIFQSARKTLLSKISI